MNLQSITEEIEKLDCKVVILNDFDCNGRYIKINNQHFIFLKAETSEIEKINIILHERIHLKEKDCDNLMSKIETYKHHIENKAEKGRILDFMSLVNQEYPIDENFNYIAYMKRAYIPDKYEDYVKKIAQQFYQDNKDKNII